MNTVLEEILLSLHEQNGTLQFDHKSSMKDCLCVWFTNESIVYNGIWSKVSASWQIRMYEPVYQFFGRIKFVFTFIMNIWNCLNCVWHRQCVPTLLWLVYMWLDLRKPSLSAQEMKFNLLLIIKSTLLHYLKIPST